MEMGQAEPRQDRKTSAPLWAAGPQKTSGCVGGACEYWDAQNMRVQLSTVQWALLPGPFPVFLQTLLAHNCLSGNTIIVLMSLQVYPLLPTCTRIPQDFQGAGDGDWTRAEAWAGVGHGQAQEIIGIECKNKYYGPIVGQMSQGSGQWQGGTLDQTEDWEQGTHVNLRHFPQALVGAQTPCLRGSGPANRMGLWFLSKLNYKY